MLSSQPVSLPLADSKPVNQYPAKCETAMFPRFPLDAGFYLSVRAKALTKLRRFGSARKKGGKEKGEMCRQSRVATRPGSIGIARVYKYLSRVPPG